MVHSESHFLPVVTATGVERPTIHQAFVQGYVFLEVDIPIPGRVGYKYGSDISAAIVAALAYNTPLALRPHQVIRAGNVLQRDGVHVQVDNPTLERMQAALTNGAELSDYFAEHHEPITTAAGLLQDALLRTYSQRSHAQSVHDGLARNVELAKTPELTTKLQDATDRLAEIDSTIEAKLREGTDTIAHLSEGLPKGLLDYATDKKLKTSRCLFAVG